MTASPRCNDRAGRLGGRHGVAVVRVLVAVMVVFDSVTGSAEASKPVAAQVLMSQAQAEYGAGHHDHAAQLFRRAYDLDPKPEYLFNAARAEQRAFKLDAAEHDFAAYLSLAAATDEGKRRARVHLQEVRATRQQLQQAMAGRSASQLGSLANAQPELATAAWRRPAGWVVAGAGLLAVAAGAWIWGAVEQDQEALDGRVADRDFEGKIIGIDWTDYERQQRNLNRLRPTAQALTGGGVCVIGLGVYLLASSGEQRHVALLVSSERVAFSLRF